MPRSSYMKKKSTNQEDEARRQKRRNYVLACSNNPEPNTYDPFVPVQNASWKQQILVDLQNEAARDFIATGDESLIEHFPKPKATPSAVR